MRLSFLLIPAAALAMVYGCVGADPSTPETVGPDADSGTGGASSSSGGDTGTAGPSIAVTAAAPSVTVVPSKSVTFDVTVTRGGGFSGAVNVTLTGLPAGVTAAPLSVAANETTGTVTLVASDTPSQGVVTLGLAAQSTDGTVGGTGSLELVVRGLPGALDTSFASTGIMADASLLIADVAVQKDNKIVLVGSAPASGPFQDNYGAVRLTTDGKLDPGFGTAGLFKATLGFPTPGKKFVQSVAIDAAGIISIAGIASSDKQRLGIIQVDATGKIVPAFDPAGTNGLGPDTDSFGRAVRLFGGNAYIAGFASTVIGGNIVVGKVTPAGFDTTYGTAGMVTVASHYLTTTDEVIQADGKIVVGGHAGDDGGDAYASVTRLNADGTVDTTFATAGTYKYDLTGSTEQALGLALLDGGKIGIVGVKGQTAGATLLIQVLLPSGAIDNTFVSNVGGPGTGHKLLARADGSLVVVGEDTGAYAWRLLKSGAPDPAFNGGTPAIANGQTGVVGAALDGYDRVVIATTTSVVRMWL